MGHGDAERRHFGGDGEKTDPASAEGFLEGRPQVLGDQVALDDGIAEIGDPHRSALRPLPEQGGEKGVQGRLFGHLDGLDHGRGGPVGDRRDDGRPPALGNGTRQAQGPDDLLRDDRRPGRPLPPSGDQVEPFEDGRPAGAVAEGEEKGRQEQDGRAGENQGRAESHGRRVRTGGPR